MSSETDNSVETSFLKLQEIESDIKKAEEKVEQFKNELFKPIYENRRIYLNQIPKFWYIVLAQHEEFQEYISVEDMKYIELISDIYVEFKNSIDDDGLIPKKAFSITMSFKNTEENKDNKIKEQQVTKEFEWELDPSTGMRKLVSEKVAFEWPINLQKIDPETIKSNVKKENRKLTSEEKKFYRQGMRSFFSFWSWTGRKEGKEYRNGEELASLISEDIFPGALDYYVIAQNNGGEDGDSDDDAISGEELDLSDPEEEASSSKRQKI